jgi:hypothetical protein
MLVSGLGRTRTSGASLILGSYGNETKTKGRRCKLLQGILCLETTLYEFQDGFGQAMVSVIVALVCSRPDSGGHKLTFYLPC